MEPRRRQRPKYHDDRAETRLKSWSPRNHLWICFWGVRDGRVCIRGGLESLDHQGGLSSGMGFQEGERVSGGNGITVEPCLTVEKKSAESWFGHKGSEWARGEGEEDYGDAEHTLRIPLPEYPSGTQSHFLIEDTSHTPKDKHTIHTPRALFRSCHD